MIHDSELKVRRRESFLSCVRKKLPPEQVIQALKGNRDGPVLQLGKS